MITWMFNNIPCVAAPILIVIWLLYLARNDILEILISWGLVDAPEPEPAPKRYYRRTK